MQRSRPRHRAVASMILAVSVLIAEAIWAGVPDNLQEPRNFDARADFNAGYEAVAFGSQDLAVEALRADIPELDANLDQVSGVTRSLYNRTGFLTPPSSGDALEIALDYTTKQKRALGLLATDLAHYRVQDRVFSRVTGATHLYLIQEHRGLPVYNGQLHINVNRDGRILSVNNAFVHDLASSIQENVPVLSADDAVLSVALHLGLATAEPRTLEALPGPERRTRLKAADLSQEEIEAQLMWLPIRRGDTRLVWNFQIHTLDSRHWYDFNVDARNGEVWTRFDWIDAANFRVYEQPIESPQHTTPLPPADARGLQLSPEDANASPNGWFSGGLLDGNNVHACIDTNDDDVCDNPQPICFGSVCDFPLDLSNTPAANRPAAVTNLFYWNNLIHDIQYKYGFDEAAGNFQEDNFGRGGLGSDSVNADAQDQTGNCNASFLTPPDGSNPRMNMFVCFNALPARDGALDNGMIVHEYGHGISDRQVGGPSNVSCLNNAQQPSEGWSDWLSLAYTAEVGDLGSDQRGIGSYFYALPADGTIRPQPYSTDPSINNYTYASISGLPIPHGVGSVWAQALWEVYWALVDEYGFDPDLSDATGGAGNQRAMLYINEGLKNTACGPTFLDARDGILLAAVDNFDGDDVCLLWDAFADFGLGVDASTPGPSSTTATDGSAVPATCNVVNNHFQIGTETTDENIRTVNLSGFTHPIVVMGPPSFTGSNPTTVRLQNVTASSFQHRLEEWDYLDGPHANESIGYLSVEAGNTSIGALDVEAGSVDIDTAWTTVTFNQPFSSAPVVVAQVVTVNESEAVTTRLRNIGPNSFQVRLQEEEGNDGIHAVETVHYIAIETGVTLNSGSIFLVGRTGESVDHAFSTLSFDFTITNNPLLLADMQTYNGGNPATLRHRNLTSTSVEIKVEEERSADQETTHRLEDVGFIAISN